MSLKTLPYDTAESLGDEEDIALFAEAVLEEGDPTMFRKALDVIARARGFTHLAEKAGIPRRQLFTAFLDEHEGDGSAIKAALVAASLHARREAAE